MRSLARAKIEILPAEAKKSKRIPFADGVTRGECVNSGDEKNGDEGNEEKGDMDQLESDLNSSSDYEDEYEDKIKSKAKSKVDSKGTCVKFEREANNDFQVLKRRRQQVKKQRKRMLKEANRTKYKKQRTNARDEQQSDSSYSDASYYSVQADDD